jgi:hypothetical protein
MLYGHRVKNTIYKRLSVNIIETKIFNNIIVKLDYHLPQDIPQSNFFIADIAGKDSIAALIRVLDENLSAVIIPSVIDLACEYGDKNQYYKVLSNLNDKFNKERRRILPGIISYANDFWSALAGGYVQEPIKLYGFYSPCIACHLVMHIIRIKIATYLGLQNVISGERELHANKEKINQLAFVIDFYNSLYAAMGVKHHLPLRYVIDNDEINKVIDINDVIYNQLNCLFTGNYYQKGTSVFAMDIGCVREYLDSYLPLQVNSSKTVINVNCKVIDL